MLWAWHVMTGDNVFILRRQEKDTWKRIDMVPEDDVKDRRACGWRSTAEVYTDDQIWTLLKKYDAQKALMSASIAKSSSGKFSGPCGEEMLEKEGLVAGHAYSVIQAREVTEGGLMGVINGTQGWRSAMDGGTRYRLLQVRNPWGSFEWKGAWSDKSEMWDKNPSIKQQVTVHPCKYLCHISKATSHTPAAANTAWHGANSSITRLTTMARFGFRLRIS